ncbi:EAL domain-containing protein [Rhodococcus sp. NPDC057529]|uniref:EAL domain-containing protein n=1 Tax=Rhodococcus sp. NPDC057529 TaxID=3346158 RepID=UPI00366E185F
MDSVQVGTEKSVTGRRRVGLGSDVVAIEAVARWQHPTPHRTGRVHRGRRTHRPDRITGPVGAADRRRAGRGLARPHPGDCGVNISSQQLHDPAFANEVTEILAAAGLPAESAGFRDRRSVWAAGILSALRAAGIAILRDDFGTPAPSPISPATRSSNPQDRRHLHRRPALPASEVPAFLSTVASPGDRITERRA